MTEPDVASSDATNMAATAVVDGDEVVVNGRKWWSTGVGNPDCRIFVFMGLTDPDADRHHRHSMVLVPRDTPGVKVERMLTAMGILRRAARARRGLLHRRTGARWPTCCSDPGEAFAIAQGRLGPGRVHHCMRLVGLAELALELACKRVSSGRVRQAAGLARRQPGADRRRPDRHRQARLLVLDAAWKLDTGGSLNALSEVSQIKVAVPTMAQQVIDMAMQLHGGGGLSDDFPLAAAWTSARALRLADGPDEVHRGVVARLELAKYGATR